MRESRWARRRQEARQARLTDLAEAYVLGFAWFVIGTAILLPFAYAAVVMADRFPK